MFKGDVQGDVHIRCMYVFNVLNSFLNVFASMKKKLLMTSVYYQRQGPDKEMVQNISRLLGTRSVIFVDNFLIK